MANVEQMLSYSLFYPCNATLIGKGPYNQSQVLLFHKRNIFYTTRVGKHLGCPEIERRKKILKESKMIDGERKS